MEYFERNFTVWGLWRQLKAEDVDLLCHSVTILATHGWEWEKSTNFGNTALETIPSRFEIPLAKVPVFQVDMVIEEWDNMVEYARQYFNLVDSYKVVWWKLFSGRMRWCWLNCCTVSL